MPPRKPRNLDQYVPKEFTAAFLREQADLIEAGPSPLSKAHLQLWFWNPAWEKPVKTKAKPKPKAQRRRSR